MVRFVNSLYYWLAVGFGSGLINPAPGTWGTLLGALLWWALLTLSLPIAIVLLALGTVLGGEICRIGGERLGEVDHGSIVWDEIIAIGWLLMLVVLYSDLSLNNVLVSFALFRLFDITKPYPINLIDAWHTPWSVMFDDLLAAAYAGIGFFILIWLIS
jgi:phosphatidylglycerophosphatase A